MSKPKLGQKKRAARRAEERARDKLTRSRQRLQALEEGGSAERPIEVPSASVVETRATAERCAACDTPLGAAAHEAVIVDGARLRKVALTCPRCGLPRTMWFRIIAPALN